MFVATEPTQSTVAMSMEYDALHLLMRRSFKAHFKHALTDFVSRGSEADIFQALLDDVEVSLKSKQQSAIDEAVNILRKKFPKNPRAVVEYGNNLLRKSNIAEATAVAEELLAQVPDNVRALSLLARAKLHAKKFDEAIALMERCESLSPEFVDRLILFGEIYWSKGQHKEAREKYEAAIALDAQNVDAKMGVAMTAASMGNEAEALSLLGGSLSRDEIAGFFNNAGIVASHRGRFDESVRLYESAMMQIDNSEQKAKVLFNMGLAHERAGRASEAQSSFEKAQTLAPQMQKAAQHLHQHLHQHSAETPKASSEKITKEKNK
jgi:tetratricopeptide (TPR) repeat protein